MLQTKTQLTLEEFLALPEGEGDIIYELIDEQAVPKMSPKKFHSRLTRSLIKLLEQWGDERGEIGVEWAVKLTRHGRDWVPVPDLLYVSYQRLSPDWNQDEACPVVPELVIEIISPEQTFGQLAAKARDYLDAKVLRVWIVDSKARSITVFYPDAPPQTYRGDTLLKDPLFEGLEFTAEQLFQMAKIPPTFL
ncbi:Uma2 family endonuclease [Microcoleus vaginatus]|uniref:Uma2 family endonuclease n=1 Tax=Microcoleus vaginatus TaxID=119532 RepID=UPI001682722C|nr:Uma2 family endonuclease [Microcoleus sp. FACHB-84]MBD2008477.1 Uma2 family endonuclease [Microcoleus sp. FACHB-45]